MRTISREALRDIRVLVVDDDMDSRDVAGGLLRMYGATVTLVDSADAALEHLQRERPDVLLSDLSMPDVDGFQLCRSVRSRWKEPPIPAAAVSGLASIEDRDRALAAGFDAHLAKPIEPESLVQLVFRLARGRELASLATSGRWARPAETAARRSCDQNARAGPFSPGGGRSRPRRP